MKPVVNVGDSLRALREHGGCMSATRVLDRLSPEHRDEHGEPLDGSHVTPVLDALAETRLVTRVEKVGGLVVYRAVERVTA
jgi:Fe2+ or Zn2+ uptake regulation protein